MPADKNILLELESNLNKTVSKLNKISTKKMFGCHAIFANKNVFALVWKHGRIAVKLMDGEAYEGLMAVKGADPWKAGTMQMKNWVLVPENFNENLKSLTPWVKLAHEQALNAPAKVPKKTKTSKNQRKK